MRFFWIFFLQKGGSYLFQKGVIIKKLGIFGYFCQKGGSHPIHRDFIIKKLRIFNREVRQFHSLFAGLFQFQSCVFPSTLFVETNHKGGGGSDGFHKTLFSSSYI